MASKLLTKSKYMNGLQCFKYLWLIFHEPDQIPVPDASQQHLFDQGHLVGDFAKKLFPKGIEVPNESFMGNIKSTRELLTRKLPLFEAGFMVNGLFSRVDILNPAEKGAWDIVEVKSSTSVKNENLQDVAFQKLCCQKQGLEIRKCYLCFINNKYVKIGEIVPAQLFTIEDVTEAVAEAGEGVEENVAIMQEVISESRRPESLIGSNCHDPYDCPVTNCWKELPPNNILSLYRGGKKAFELFNQGILFMKDIPEGVKLSKAQEIQKACDISGSAHAETDAIIKFLETLEYPLNYLDFETFAPAIPLFDGTRPYQKIPFQYSLHVEDRSGKLEHFSFLANGPQDPRPALLKQLKTDIRPSGSILTYNQSFEQGVLEELARTFPEYADWIGAIIPRLSDLIIPFRNFQYYHPAQEGSASIKHVLPALVGKSYAGMNIAAGDAASLAYLDMTYGNLTEPEKAQIRQDLEQYCGLDTEAMVLIVKKLGQVGA